MGAALSVPLTLDINVGRYRINMTCKSRQVPMRHIVDKHFRVKTYLVCNLKCLLQFCHLRYCLVDPGHENVNKRNFHRL